MFNAIETGVNFDFLGHIVFGVQGFYVRFSKKMGILRSRQSLFLAKLLSTLKYHKMGEWGRPSTNCCHTVFIKGLVASVRLVGPC